jgi:hypothetical protein
VPKQKKLKAKEVAYPVMFIVLAILVGLAAYQQASTNGWNLWNIGGNNHNNNQNQTITVIPINQLGFKMQLVAVQPGGSNFTVSSSQSLPSLATIAQFPVEVNNRTISYIEADGLAAVQSSKSFSNVALAEFRLNMTAMNLQTGYTRWVYEDITAPFVNGATLAMVLLPSMKMTAAQVFSNLQCSVSSNGTTLCAPVGTAPSLVQLNFVVTGNVTVTDPSTPGFSFVPLSGSYASAMRLGLGATACVNCGGGGTSITGAVTISGGSSAEVHVPTGGSPPVALGSVAGTSTVTVTAGTPGSGTYGITVKDSTGTTTHYTEKAGTAGGTGKEGTSGKAAIAAGDKIGGITGGRIELLPPGSVLPLSFGNWTVFLNWPLLLATVGFLIFLVVAVFLIVRVMLKRRR